MKTSTAFLALLVGLVSLGTAEDSAFTIAAVVSHPEALDKPHDIELVGNLAFVPGKGGSLAFIDVADPQQPELIWHRHDPNGLHDAETVLPILGRLFLGTDDLRSIDIRKPREPRFDATLSRPEFSKINGMVQRGDMIFAACKNGYLAAFDISEPSAPTFFGAVNLKAKFDIESPHDIDLFGPYAVISDPRGFGRKGRGGKLALVQVYRPDGVLNSPEDWELAGVVASDELAGANRVQVRENYAFVGASTSAQGGNLVVLNLASPDSPQQVASIPFAPEDGWGPNGLTIAGNVVFLAGGQSVEAIDISQPERPVKLASQRFAKELPNADPRYEGGGDSGHDLVYQDGYLYVTGQNDHCLLILRVDSDVIRKLTAHSPELGEIPPELRLWLEASQTWQRDTEGAVVSLGEEGAFDDTHIFAPMVSFEEDEYHLWYCGSTRSVAERVFHMGLAESSDGRLFHKVENNPVYSFGDGKHSILTPTLLRAADGRTLREDGKLRMWFSSTWFSGGEGLHTLHETASEDGVHWSAPSEAQLKHVYSPTIIKEGREYRMWYIDVEKEPWILRYAWSLDGVRWRVDPEPCLVIDQDWEKSRLFYPTVLKADGVYQLWYGSYWSEEPNKTAIGFAVSIDGLKWYKHPKNPVMRPDPERPWESNYTTSQSVIRFEDGSYRMWYASRKAPPFVNKYFAINTAKWKPDPPAQKGTIGWRILESMQTFQDWKELRRRRLQQELGIPDHRVPLASEKRGELEWDGIVVEKWVFTSEPGSRIPALVYRPVEVRDPAPAIVFTYGHGGSKSAWQYHYAAQLYARLGLVCLAIDPLGEEERHRQGRLGTRAHDPKSVSDRAQKAGRLIMGKLVFDTMRGIDFLYEREDIDRDRIGVAGNSLGGAVAGWMAALEPRIQAALVCGWAYDDVGLRTKYCTKIPNQRMRRFLTWVDYATLAAPDCSVLIANGNADWVIDKGEAEVWERTRKVVEIASTAYQALGSDQQITAWFEAAGGHRPYFAYRDSLKWIHQQLGTPAMTLDEIQNLPVINAGEWCDQHGITLERLYGTDLHQRGATLPDLGIRPIPRSRISCLKPGEIGAPEFTVEGWLEVIELASGEKER